MTTIALQTDVTTRIPATTWCFDLTDESGYRAWRKHKLQAYPGRPADLIVTIQDPLRLSEKEKRALLERCAAANMAIYELADSGSANPESVNPESVNSGSANNGPVDKAAIRALGRQMGLERLDHNLCADDDGITSLRVNSEGVNSEARRGEYIPYTDRRLNWHTDGYYNSAGERIRAFLTHCVAQGAVGGENSILDHEMAYLLLRDENPDFIAALMQPQAMTIPANIVGGELIRPARTGPVFSVDPTNGCLHMNYTARSRSIKWKQDSTTRDAVAFLGEILCHDSPYVLTHRLEPGQGLICNNVLHSRAAFEDGVHGHSRRLLYRARYYDRIDGRAAVNAEQWSGRANALVE